MTAEENRTIYHSFLAVTDCPKDSVILQAGETEDYRWLTEEDFREFWKTGDLLYLSVLYPADTITVVGRTSAGREVLLFEGLRQ